MVWRGDVATHSTSSQVLKERTKISLGALLSQPALYRVSAVFSFPFFQHLVIAALGLDDFTGVRILVNLDGAGFPGAFGLSGSWSTAARCQYLLAMYQSDDSLLAMDP